MPKMGVGVCVRDSSQELMMLALQLQVNRHVAFSTYPAMVSTSLPLIGPMPGQVLLSWVQIRRTYGALGLVLGTCCLPCMYYVGTRTESLSAYVTGAARTSQPS